MQRSHPNPGATSMLVKRLSQTEGFPIINCVDIMENVVGNYCRLDSL